MRAAIDTYTKLVDYQVGDVTAAATYYIAEIYYEFSVALIESERPSNVNDEELEQSIGQAAREKVINIFTTENMISQTLSSYNHILIDSNFYSAAP